MGSVKERNDSATEPPAIQEQQVGGDGGEAYLQHSISAAAAPFVPDTSLNQYMYQYPQYCAYNYLPQQYYYNSPIPPPMMMPMPVPVPVIQHVPVPMSMHPNSMIVLETRYVNDEVLDIPIPCRLTPTYTAAVNSHRSRDYTVFRSHAQSDRYEIRHDIGGMTKSASAPRGPTVLWEYCQANKETFPLINALIPLMSSHERETWALSIVAGANFTTTAYHATGNFLVQEVMRTCDYEGVIRNTLLGNVRDSAVELSYHKYGSRVIQRCLDTLSREERVYIADALVIDALNLSRDKYASHVVEKCIEHQLDNMITTLTNISVDDIVLFANSQHSCLVLRKLLNKLPLERSIIIMNKIIDNMLLLANDMYGNYAVQFLIERGPAEVKDKLIDLIIDSLGVLSVDKYSSNVVETAYQMADVVHRTSMLRAIVTNRVLLTRMSECRFGSYVLHFLLDPSQPRVARQEFMLITYDSPADEQPKATVSKYIKETSKSISSRCDPVYRDQDNQVQSEDSESRSGAEESEELMELRDRLHAMLPSLDI